MRDPIAIGGGPRRARIRASPCRRTSTAPRARTRSAATSARPPSARRLARAVRSVDDELVEAGPIVGGAVSATAASRWRAPRTAPRGRRGHGSARRRTSTRRFAAGPRRPARLGRARAAPPAPRCCAPWPTRWRRHATAWSRSWPARPARRWPTASPRCARRPTSAATTRVLAETPVRRPRDRCPARSARPTARAARPRRLRLHQPVELPAGHLHRPDRRGAGRRQRGAGQAGRADPADRRRGGAALPRRRPRPAPAGPAARRRRDRRRGADRPPGAATASPSPAAPRRPGASTARSPPRDGPIVPFIAETGGLNGMFVDTTALREQVIDDVIALGLRLGRPALLGAARAVRARRDRRRADRGPRRRHGRPGDRRPGRSGHRRRPGDRRRGARQRWRRTSSGWSARPRCISRLDPGPGRRGASSAPCWPRSPTPDFLEREVFGPILHVLPLRHRPTWPPSPAGWPRAAMA